MCGDKIEALKFCEHNVFGKAAREKFKKAIHNTKDTLDYIHSYLWGPFKVPSLGGKRYILTLTDDFSRTLWIYLLKLKNAAFEKFVQWKTLVENHSNKKIKRLRTDNCLEFCVEEFDNYCNKNGIARHHIVRNTPQQNGLAERMNRTILERVRCVLSCASLSKAFWGDDAATVCFLINRSSSIEINFKTPEEI